MSNDVSEGHRRGGALFFVIISPGALDGAGVADAKMKENITHGRGFRKTRWWSSK